MLKFFTIVALLFVPFFILFVNTSDTFASGNISTILSSQAQFSKNFDGVVRYDTRSSYQLPGYVVAQLDENFTGFWDYSQNFVFANPSSQKSGTGFSHTIYFTLSSVHGNYLNSNLQNLAAQVRFGFEGIDTSGAYCSKYYNIVSMTGNSVRYKMQASCPAGTFSTNQNFNNVLVSINYSPDSIFWCANDNSDLTRHCYSNAFYVQLSDVDYSFALSTNSADGLTQTMINQSQEYYDKTYEAVDNINNQSSSDINNATSSQTTSIIGTISSFVTALGTVQTGSCELTLPFPQFIGGNTTVNPCTAKEKAPTIVTIGSSMFLIGVFIPFAFMILKMIYNEIRSFTNG